MLDCKADISAQDSVGHTPLHNAAHEGHLEVVRFLASRSDCHPNMVDSNKRTALHYACQNGHYAVVALLIAEANCQVDLRDKTDSTPFHIAAFAGRTDIVKFLARLDECDVHRLDNQGRNAVHFVSQEGYIDILKFLVLECKMDYSIADTAHGVTPIHLASSNGHTDIVKFLCSLSGVNCDVKDKHDRTPLYYACKDGNLDVVKFLVKEKQCDISSTDKMGMSCFGVAVLTNSNAVVTFLKEHDPSLSTVASGDNVAQSSIRAGNVLSHLLSGLKGNLGDLQLLKAAGEGDLETVKSLAKDKPKIVFGANQETPLHLARLCWPSPCC